MVLTILGRWADTRLGGSEPMVLTQGWDRLRVAYGVWNGRGLAQCLHLIILCCLSHPTYPDPNLERYQA